MSVSIPTVAPIDIPNIGYGTGTKWYKYGNDELDTNLISTLVTALKKGINHIDFAEVYNTDLEVAEAIKQSGIKRSDLFLTDKYFAGDSTYTAHSKDANPLLRLKKILSILNTDNVDLYLLHAPFIKTETHGFSLKEAWNFMEECKEEGLAKHIGVSNFQIEELETISKDAKYKPEVNQIEFNAFLQNQTPGIVDYCQKNNILIEAYSPLGPLYKGDLSKSAGKVFDDYITELADKYSVSKLQILLRWVQKKGIVPISTSSKPERMDEFLSLSNLELTDEEVKKITELGSDYKPQLRQYWKPEYSKYD
ncbi:aldo-keto reductase (NADP) activity protein [[Candida] boidinii]|nr:aldo-keto reductase (NADP) activity protein [[Candida] boidinii]